VTLDRDPSPAGARRPLALITGATAGIGAEFARQLAASGHDLVIVARSSERLDRVAVSLRERYGVAVEALARDLGTPDGVDAVERRLAASDRPVDLLVNNAGFGLRRPFDENDVDEEQALLDLLVAVPMRLTHAALGPMLARGSGTVINIASVAGYLSSGTYSAAKAWLLHFSRWANRQYRSRGVAVTAVAPGFVRTEFHQRMGVGSDFAPAVLWLKVEQLVRIALRDAARGRAVSIPTLRYKVVVAVIRLLPAGLLAGRAIRGR
jgi:short-subunit dehydrogenase